MKIQELLLNTVPFQKGLLGKYYFHKYFLSCLFVYIACFFKTWKWYFSFLKTVFYVIIMIFYFVFLLLTLNWLFPKGFSSRHLFVKVININTRAICEIYSKLIIKTSERRLWRVNFEQISYIILMFTLLTLGNVIPSVLLTTNMGPMIFLHMRKSDKR